VHCKHQFEENSIAAISHLNALLEGFLSLGKLEEGKMDVEKTICNVQELVAEVIEELEPFKKTGQLVQFEAEGDKLFATDKKLLKNIISNLLNNALKFSNENKTIFINSRIQNNKLVLSIKDEGIGISKEDQKHLFESFYRGKNVQTIQGTGLGLHIVQRYVRLLNGTITLDSSLNKGTMVTLSLKDP
jgi:signal transduction histidine kinase